MTTPNSTPPNCRCSICGVCYHDHRGWYHQWEVATPNEAPGGQPWGYVDADLRDRMPGEDGTGLRPFATYTGLEHPILVDTGAAAVYAGRDVKVIYRWAGEGRLTRYGTRGKGNALWDVRELKHWASDSGDPMPPPPPVKPQNFQDRLDK